jgi:hypothetical protein
VGLRKLLTRQPAEDPLEHLAELGREAESTAPSTGLFAQMTTEDEAAPLSSVALDKKVVEVFAAESKKRVERRRDPSYVWRSQASRAGRASWADMPERF